MRTNRNGHGRVRGGAIVAAWGALSFGAPALADETLPGVESVSPTDFREIVQHAKGRVFPAVVFIRCMRETHDAGKRIAQEISGSGVIISPKGEVLTNWHVVDKATEVRCLLYDGTPLDATILGSDKDTDLALIQLHLPENASPLPYASLADSSRLTEGDFVMAMGAPWGMSRSVSIGIISSVRRYLPENSEYSLWLQTDAAISPGNSGGPLVNTAGEIVGINTRGIMAGGDMGFSVPSNTVAELLPQLREHGEVQWSWTGIQLQPLRDFNRKIYFDGDHGVIVAGTDPESPARRAGIEPRDRIVKIDGASVAGLTEEDLPSIRRTLGLLPKNMPVLVSVERDAETLEFEITPREKGRVEGEELDCPRWDMTVKAINQFDNPDLHFHRQEGVFILGVRWPGNASTAGFRQQDIILEIDGEAVTTLEDVKMAHTKAIDNLTSRRRIMFSILRNGQVRRVVLDFSRDYERR